MFAILTHTLSNKLQQGHCSVSACTVTVTAIVAVTVTVAVAVV